MTGAFYCFVGVCKNKFTILDIRGAVFVIAIHLQGLVVDEEVLPMPAGVCGLDGRDEAGVGDIGVVPLVVVVFHKGVFCGLLGGGAEGEEEDKGEQGVFHRLKILNYFGVFGGKAGWSGGVESGNCCIFTASFETLHSISYD